MESRAFRVPRKDPVGKVLRSTYQHSLPFQESMQADTEILFWGVVSQVQPDSAQVVTHPLGHAVRSRFRNKKLMLKGNPQNSVWAWFLVDGTSC